MEEVGKEGPARIESLKVRNYRALRDVTFKDLTPLTVLIGPNGSGKSTVCDVLAFLSECFELNLRTAWDRRGRGQGIKSRGSDGPVVIEIKYREHSKTVGTKGNPLITYHLEIDEDKGQPVIVHEWLRWNRKGRGRPFKFLEVENGEGEAASGELPDEDDERAPVKLRSKDLLAVNALGQFVEHPRIAKLRDFIIGWHVSYLSVDEGRSQPESGPQDQLSRTGHNLANVIQHLRETDEGRLKDIIERLAYLVPLVSDVRAEPMPDGRLLLQLVDAPFEKPIISRYTSDGTLKMLAYLVLLHGSDPYPLIAIEEPENFLHPELQSLFSEECSRALHSTQLLITTHSPDLLDGLKAEEVYILWRDENGYTILKRASDIWEVQAMAKTELLGGLWSKGVFGVGDPLSRIGIV